MSKVITLEWYEAEQAIYVGARREAETIRKGVPVECFSEETTSIDNHIQSAGAEKAVAKLLNLDWHASINEFRDGVADVGSRVEVRFRRNQWDLKVKKNDHDDRCYVLAWGELPTFELVGWLWGRNAKHDCFWKNPGKKQNGFAYFVPPDYLRPIEELMEARFGPNRAFWEGEEQCGT